MQEQLEQLKTACVSAIASAKEVAQLEAVKTQYFGRKGKLNDLMKVLAELPPEERKQMGKTINDVKQELEGLLLKAEQTLSQASALAQAEQEWIDVTEPSLQPTNVGGLHPVTQVQQELEDLFTSMGFMVLDGPELESDFYNFTALNIPPSHPARDMQDTFYIDGKTGGAGTAGSEELGWVMRTHTSTFQVRAMREFGVPLRAIVPGRCFRNEATDARHEHTFHQLEGIVVGEGISFADMKGVFQVVADYLYGKGTKIRLSPKFYPFVEPGVRGELSCFLCKGQGCRVCKQSGWLEAMPGGMIHPSVLRQANIDPEKYSGFAFGFGLTRLVMLKYGIDDIRHLESGDLRFLKQF